MTLTASLSVFCTFTAPCSEIKLGGMPMIVTIHQPSYLPWIPFIEKGLRADVYVLLDHVQFEKNSAQNRNRIKTAQGELWLTVPVSRSSKTRILDVTIPPTAAGWNIKHRQSIEMNYSKAPFFQEVADTVFPILETPWKKLVDLNLALDRAFLSMALFSGRIVRSSEMKIIGSSSDLILSICRDLGADTYLSGVAGSDYLDLAAFETAGIKVLFQHYQHAEYPQRFPKVDFLPRLSALDLFMNVGTGDAAISHILKKSSWATAAELKKRD